MTVTRVWQSGFELGSNADEGGSNVIFTGSMAYETSNVRTGARALQMGTGRFDFYYTLSSAIAQARVNLQFYYNGGGGGLGDPEIIYFRNSVTEIIRVKYEISSGTWKIWAGTSSTQIASTVNSMTAGNWHRICADVKIDNSAGWVSVYLDGTEIIDYDGQTDHGAANFNHIGVGPITGTRRWGTGEIVDDVTFDDTVGEATPADSVDRRYFLAGPNGAGNYSQWTASAGTNYENVDELPPDDDTTYNESNTVNQKDSYMVVDHTPDSGWKVDALIPIAVTRKVVAGANDIRLFLREGGTDAVGGTETQDSTYDTFWDRQTAPPSGGDITQTVLNDIEAGVEVI